MHRYSKHFAKYEFICKCGKCRSVEMDPHIISILELVRKHFSKPVIITSAYRCPTHNKNVGGAPLSKHVQAIAVDIKVKDVNPSVVYKFVDETFPYSLGVGSYNSFTHIDVRETKARW